MIDSYYQARRYVTEFCKVTDRLLAEYELLSVDLQKFQLEFGINDANNPMFDCYPIHLSNISFIKPYMASEPDWDLKNKSYFIESHSIKDEY